MIHDPDDNRPLPYDTDAFDPRAPQKPRPAVLGEAFAYDGRGMHPDQFAQYVQTYDFGKVPPDFIVFHHTAIPDASWAPIGANVANHWDRGEGGLSDDEIRIKRKRQVDALRTYYRDTQGWNAGPHLLIDDRFIWLFTPMADVGIHAKWGNSFRAHQKLHYSIGIEVVGYYERVPWPAPVAANVRVAVQALARRLDIKLDYMYANAPKPGMKVVNGQQVCAMPGWLKWGGLSSHRDYNKLECPGGAITEAFYTSVVQGSTPLPAPEPITKRYRVKRRYVTQRKEDNGPPIVRELQSGEIVTVDAWYTNNRVHLASGEGFVDLADLEAV